MKVCFIQDNCPYYESGDNKPPNHHIRLTLPCVKFINDACPMPTDIRLFFGETIACPIDKRKEFGK